MMTLELMSHVTPSETWSTPLRDEVGCSASAVKNAVRMFICSVRAVRSHYGDAPTHAAHSNFQVLGRHPHDEDPLFFVPPSIVDMVSCGC